MENHETFAGKILFNTLSVLIETVSFSCGELKTFTQTLKSAILGPQMAIQRYLKRGLRLDGRSRFATSGKTHISTVAELALTPNMRIQTMQRFSEGYMFVSMLHKTIRDSKRTLSVFICILLLGPASHAADSVPLVGKYALQGGSALTDGHLKLSQVGGNPLKQRIDFWMTLPNSTAAIHTYAVEMTKKLHVVVVSSDFSIFLHIHPELNANGHFQLDQEFPQSWGLLHLRRRPTERHESSSFPVRGEHR